MAKKTGRKLVLDTVGQTIYHHTINEGMKIVVVESINNFTGVQEYTLAIEHFNIYRRENPIRIFTDVPAKYCPNYGGEVLPDEHGMCSLCGKHRA
jgi:hypothetical protein